MTESATLNIRAARHNDVEACFELFREVQEMHVAERPDLFKPPALDDNFRRLVADAIDAEHKGILLAWHGERAVGILIYEFTRLDPTGVYLIDRPILWLESIGVTATYRGKGCGKAMLDLARRIAAEVGVEDLALEAWHFNDAARAWFERQGFQAHSMTMMAKVAG
jgi:ribosomal protein S18 acetylase RimI-like enzyme